MWLCCVLGWDPLARADTLADFEKGRSSYEGGRYDEAATKFRDMLSPGAERLEPWLLEKVRTYYAACLIALGRFKEADAQIEAILRVNPAGRPDPVVFPSAVLDRFIEVAARIRKDLEADAQRRADEEKLRKEKEAEEKRKERERVAELEKLARQEVHVTHNSRWFALVPFGVGQFQNRQTGLGVTFLGTEGRASDELHRHERHRAESSIERVRARHRPPGPEQQSPRRPQCGTASPG